MLCCTAMLTLAGGAFGALECVVVVVAFGDSWLETRGGRFVFVGGVLVAAVREGVRSV